MGNLKAVVVGGGIAGPVTGMALAKAGIEAEVYEAYDGGAEGVGGLLSIAPNGQSALDVLDAGDVVRRIGTPVEGMVIESWTGKRLGELGNVPGLPPMLTVWRGDLNRALHDEAAARGVRTTYGKRLVGVRETAREVTAVFADGSTASGDVLIGCDGIRSAVRAAIVPDAPEPRYSGLLGFGAMVPGSGVAPTAGRMRMSFGKRAFLGYMVYEDGNGGYFVNLPHAEPVPLREARARDPREWLEVLKGHFTEDRSPAMRFLERTDPADLVVTGALEDLPAVPRWSRGRAVLVGDAAHATSPSSGQGASMAIESSVVLAKCLRDLPYGEAFAAYEEIRRPRVRKIIAAGARTNANKAAGPFARVVRDAVMPLAMRFVGPGAFAWQFAYRVEWE